MAVEKKPPRVAIGNDEPAHGREPGFMGRVDSILRSHVRTLLSGLSWRLVGCDPEYTASLLVAQLWLGLLWFFYQGFGIARGLILCGFLIGLLFLRFLPRPHSSA